MEATECGAIALAIIMAYYGKYVPFEELRTFCGVSRNGSDAYNMVQAAKKYGFDAKGYSMDIKALHACDLPIILHWKFEHFVVLEGFGKDKVYINDPATGPRMISYEDLDQAFTGVAIILKPTATFFKSGKAPSLLHSLYKRIKQVKAPLIFSILVGIGLIVPNLAFPAFTRVFIDQVLMKQDFSWQTGIILGMLLAVVGTTILNFLQKSVLNRLRTRLSLRFASDAFWHMLRLPMMFYTQRYPGEVASRLALNDSISRTITGNLATTAINLLFVIVYGIAIFYYDVIIALTAIGMIAISLLLMRLAYRARSDAYARYQADQGKNMAYSLGALLDIETIKASGMEVKFFSRWVGYYTKVINVLQEVGKKDIFLAVMTPLMNSLTMLTLIAIGVWKILHGEMTIGMFVALQILLNKFMSPVMQLVGFGQLIQLLRVDIARVDDLLNHPLDAQFLKTDVASSKENESSFNKLSGHVQLHNIAFGYSPLDQPVVKGISLTLQPGKSTALVGPTGCGKSTIAKIVAGLFAPWEGEVLFDGKSRDQLPRQCIVDSLSLAEQEVFLFNGTVKDNLTLLDPSIEQENVIQATTDACIHEEILSRAGGYDLEIKENGSNLSGGQKQRIELARALLKKPTILILDEATSAVDSPVEAQIFKNIRRRGCAVLMIAHRLSTVRKCDEIIVLDKGNIVARGTHEQLMNASGIYRDLLESENRNF
ncbi:MAG: NHLP family bacteriocin export ABC transporter peptidase/permease/ATPase subunit [Parachlamydiaceae bacterium]|nr:NHLP family bacteriocin export ABC transporter peptidase/permease/ATPase subunit [Parachlamydiaceae bacterium]